MKLPDRATTPMPYNYIPELDATAELDANNNTMFQDLIGELRCATKIFRVDTLHEVLVLLAFRSSSREGYLHQLFHIFAFMKRNPKLKIYFDPRFPNIYPTSLLGSSAEEIREQYQYSIEELPKYMPDPRFKLVTIATFVDASHALDNRTIKSHTEYVIFVNRIPIVFYGKQQLTVDSSIFSSEFIAINTGTEHIIAIIFKLRMFRVDIDGISIILNDNESAVKNSSKVESTMNKKHSSISCHLVRQNVAAGVAKIEWILKANNISDSLTKRSTEAKRGKLFCDWNY